MAEVAVQGLGHPGQYPDQERLAVLQRQYIERLREYDESAHEKASTILSVGTEVPFVFVGVDTDGHTGETLGPVVTAAISGYEDRQFRFTLDAEVPAYVGVIWSRDGRAFGLIGSDRPWFSTSTPTELVEWWIARTSRA